jgi:hypothetical protein
MPRRKGSVALQAALSQGWVKIRFLLRNPQFRKDLACCYYLEEESKKHEQTVDCWDLMKKWDLAWIPLTWPKKGPGPLSEVVHAEEEFLIREMNEGKEAVDLKNRFVFRLPVESWDPDKVQEERWLEDNLEELEEKGKLCRPAFLKPSGRTLMLRVDLNYPQDILEEVIKLELKKAKRTRSTQKEHELSDSGKSRNRLDKAKWQLRIFDLVAESQTFPEIARCMAKPVSTVKSLYLAASRKIFGSIASPRTKEVSQQGFDYGTHCEKCPTCRSAITMEEMCKQAKKYACQDHKSQQDLPAENIEELSNKNQMNRTAKKR